MAVARPSGSEVRNSREDEAAACKYCDSRAEEQQDQLDKAVLKGMFYKAQINGLLKRDIEHSGYLKEEGDKFKGGKLSS